jgi:hypothetical protein
MVPGNAFEGDFEAELRHGQGTQLLAGSPEA